MPPRLASARRQVHILLEKLVNTCAKGVTTARLQREFDETYSRLVESPTWKALCSQVFDHYVGQLSFTPITQIYLLVDQLHITPGSQVLELASGTGGLSLCLAKLTKCRLIGVDASPLAVKIANRRACAEGLVEDVHFKVGILPELPCEDYSFDFVISIDSIYAVPDKTALLHSCHRVLRPKGYLGIYTLYRRRKFSDSEMNVHACGWFPSQPYFKLLQQTGFKDVSKIDLTNDLIPLAKHWTEVIQQNRTSLSSELGERILEPLLADIRAAWILAIEGYIGRALFKAGIQKPF